MPNRNLDESEIDQVGIKLDLLCFKRTMEKSAHLLFCSSSKCFLKIKVIGSYLFFSLFCFFHFLFSCITVLRFWTESHQWGKKVKKNCLFFIQIFQLKQLIHCFFVLSELPFLCNLSFEEVVQVHPAKNDACPSAWDKSRQFLSVRAVGIPMLHGSSSWGQQQQQGNAKNSSCCISLTRCCLQGLMRGSEEERG